MERDNENRDTATEWLQQGITLMQVENYAKAKEYFQKAIAAEPHNLEACMHLGNACANCEEWDEALAAFEQATLINADYGEAWFSIGNIHVLKDDFFKGIENYNKAADKGFQHIELYHNLAGLYRELGEEQQALRNLTRAIRINPLRGDIWLEKATLYINLSKFAEALETLEELQKIIPDAFEAIDLRSQIYCGLKQYDKALAIINDAVARFDRDPVLHLIKIKILVEMQDLGKAKEEIARAKRGEFFNAVAPGVLLQEAIVYSHEGALKDAVQSLERALEYEEGETDEQNRYLLMNVCIAIKDYEKAMKAAQELANTHSDSLPCISGMYYIPHIWKHQGKEAQAADGFRKLSRYLRKLTIQTPTFYEAYIYRLLCHKETGEYEKALELADYLENLYPERSDAYAMRYTIYCDMGKTEQAEQERIRAKRINPNLDL